MKGCGIWRFAGVRGRFPKPRLARFWRVRIMECWRPSEQTDGPMPCRSITFSLTMQFTFIAPSRGTSSRTSRTTRELATARWPVPQSCRRSLRPCMKARSSSAAPPLVTDEEEKRRALKLLTERFCGQGEEQDERFEKHLEQNEDGSRTAVIRIEIDRITGKRRAASA